MDDRIAKSFARQAMMQTLGAVLERADAGDVTIRLPHSRDITQQHGFIHGGALAAALDSACGYAALSLMPTDAGVLTIEFKTNFLAPARGDVVVTGTVRKAGRTVSLAEATARDTASGRELATMTATLMTVRGRDFQD